MTSQERLLWLAGRVFHLIPPRTPMPVFSGMNKGLRWIRGAANAPEWMGFYELEKQRALKDVVRPGMTAYDIGANAGFYTLGLSRMVGATGKVFAFEPLGKNVEKLLRHIALNSLSNIEVLQVAVAANNGLVSFDVGESDFQGRINPNSTAKYRVPTLRLDSAINNSSLPPPDFLKIDVEGGENQVLEGLSACLERAHPIIFLALHGDQQKHLCHSYLTRLKYSVEDLAGETILDPQQMPDEVIARVRHE